MGQNSKCNSDYFQARSKIGHGHWTKCLPAMNLLCSNWANTQETFWFPNSNSGSREYYLGCEIIGICCGHELVVYAFVYSFVYLTETNYKIVAFSLTDIRIRGLDSSDHGTVYWLKRQQFSRYILSCGQTDGQNISLCFRSMHLTDVRCFEVNSLGAGNYSCRMLYAMVCDFFGKQCRPIRVSSSGVMWGIFFRVGIAPTVRQY